jgi:hypothetical protein
MNKPRQQFKGNHAAAGRKMDAMHGKLGGNTGLANDTRPRVKVYPAPVDEVQAPATNDVAAEENQEGVDEASDNQ